VPGVPGVPGPSVPTARAPAKLAALPPPEPDAAPMPAERLADGSGQAGVTVQMTAMGPQDVFLTTSPDMTYWRSVHKRHTPFAIDTEPALFAYGLQFGKTARVDIPRAGDLLADLVLELKLPALTRLDGEAWGATKPAWIKNVGYVFLRRMRLVINDTVVHDQERLWYDICDKMFGSSAKEAGLEAMIGGGATPLDATVAHTLYVPLKFLSCRDYRTHPQYLPLVSLAGSSIYAEFETESLRGCLANADAVPEAAPPGDIGGDCRLLCNVIVLDAPERAGFLQEPTVLMFDAQQDMEQVNYRAEDRTDGGTSRMRYISVDLQELNHPVKALVFVAYKEPFDTLFEYLDVVHSATLMVGSDQRFTPQTGDYFRLVQPYQAGLRAAPDNVHAYSFCLDMASTQPSGSVNFSALDNPYLRMELATPDQDVKVKVFAMCIRWLRCHQGQAALQFV
jgi:hypothetical protein